MTGIEVQQVSDLNIENNLINNTVINSTGVKTPVNCPNVRIKNNRNTAGELVVADVPPP